VWCHLSPSRIGRNAGDQDQRDVVTAEELDSGHGGKSDVVAGYFRDSGQEGQAVVPAVGQGRSLTAIAYLLAIFKARPSPFYVLDEVEAAFDDSKLQRLLLSSRSCGELPAGRRHLLAAGTSQYVIIIRRLRTMAVCGIRGVDLERRWHALPGHGRA
jgi:hypothetical protein